jgi:dTDP-glucose 4,6-dehydratase
VEDRKGHDVRYSLDSTKIQAEIGWKAEIDFEDGIKALLNFELSRSGAN